MDAETRCGYVSFGPRKQFALLRSLETSCPPSWAEPGKEARMKRTIPIFRPLIAADIDEAYHQNYGQGGYAVKDPESSRFGRS
jgi:hypothetical protein